MKASIFLLICFVHVLWMESLAQAATCTFKPPFYHLHFGKGSITDVNTTALSQYERISYPCPGDGYYSYSPYTSDCFRGDWHTLSEDHTPGDADGNMLLVNSAYREGLFLTTNVKGFKAGATYEFGIWLMNVCRPTRKCPFPLLPNITIRLQTSNGKTVAQFNTGDIGRVEAPRWTQHRARFTAPAGVTELTLSLVNNSPGGCGNDIALDDITFRECVKVDPAKVVVEKKTTPSTVNLQAPQKPKEPKKAAPEKQPVVREKLVVTVSNQAKRPPLEGLSLAPKPAVMVPVPLVLKQRTNTLIRTIETEEGEMQLDLYDNGEIDGDTVSIYHNNSLVVSGQRLSQKPISLRIQIDKNEPRHELVMVAKNLGSIPPNTSLMIVTVNGKRYQVFISSTEQQNAKVVIVLKN